MASVTRRVTSSGVTRYDVRWRPTALERERSRSFPTLEVARAFRAQIDAEQARGIIFDPRAGKVAFRGYGEEWLESRSLGLQTRENYADTLARHVYPTFGDVAINKITPALVRRWHRPLGDRIPSTAAKSYRILRAILTTAVQDQLIARNPCAIRGAGQDPAKDRAFVPADVVLELVKAAHPRLAPMVLLAAFGGLRYGELRALRVRHYDAVAGTIAVEEALDKRSRRKSPKTAASRRVVHLPMFVLDALNEHVNNLNRDLNEHGSALNEYLNSPLLPGLAGGVMSDGWHKREWILARRIVGVPGVRFHDLRHTAGTLAAQQGATLKEVMARLGHATTAAAIRYQRAAETRDKEIAARLDSFVIDLNERRERREIDTRRANRAGWPRDGIDERAVEPISRGSDRQVFEQPQRDSNPCRHLERVVS